MGGRIRSGEDVRELFGRALSALHPQPALEAGAENEIDAV